MLICCKRWHFKTFLSQVSGPNILGPLGSGSCKRERSYVLPYKEQNVRMRRNKCYYNIKLQKPPHCTGLKKVVKYLHHGAGHLNELLLILNDNCLKLVHMYQEICHFLQQLCEQFLEGRIIQP